MARISPVPRLQFFDDNGDPLVGGKLYTYAAGTETPLATYTDAGGGTPHTNPIILDSRGEVSLWLGNSLYDFVLHTTDDVPVYTEENIGVGVANDIYFSITNGPSGTVQSALEGLIYERTSAEIAAGVTPTNYYYEPGNILRYGAATNASAATNTTAIQSAINSNDRATFDGGPFLFTQLTIPTGKGIVGNGETSILKVANGSNNNAIISTSTANIELINFTLDGNYLNQTSGSGVVLSTCTYAKVESLNVLNTYGTGILVSAGYGNRIMKNNVITAGKVDSGYGIYIFCSNYNKVSDNYVTDTCIGIVIEASGVGQTAHHNNVTGNTSIFNRPDFTQSGAGFHIEESVSALVKWNNASGNNFSSNLGPGVSITEGSANNITGNTMGNNGYAGVSMNGAEDTTVTGNNIVTNGASAPGGYQAGIYAEGCEGLISDNLISGSVDGIKTVGTSSLVITSNDARGNSSSAINLSTTGTDVTSGNKGFDYFDREPNPPVVVFDDFVGDTLNADLWGALAGTDPQCVAPVLTANQLLGLMSMTTGDDAAGTMAVNGVQLDSALTWQPALGKMVFEARVSIVSTPTDMAFFVGVTNQAGTLAMPANASGVGDGVTVNRNDACGWLFDTAMTTDNWWLVGANSGVAATPQNSGVAPAQAVYETLRIEFPATGNTATFFRNGVLVGTAMTNALNGAAPVTPVIAGFSRAAGGRLIRCDYIKMTSTR